jgi:hypothetical protein
MRTGRAPLLAALFLTAAAASSAAAATLVRGPYLQLLTTRSVTIVWNTDVAATCAVEVRPAGDAPVVLTGAVATVCAVDVDGLARGGEYRYVPLADGLPLTGESSFRVDDSERPYSFAVLGDSGTGSAAQLAVRDQLQAAAPDFVLHTGDMIYNDGAAADFDPKFFVPYAPLLRRVVFWPTLGNHDVRTASGAPWRAAFYTPANNAAGSEGYYSFDFGNAHLVVLDSNASTSPGSAQHTFLDRDLEASTAVWKFVALHHPVYSSGSHGSTLSLRANLVPVFDRHRVDVVFMGHDHNYERTVPLRADAPVAAGAGTVYVVTGGGGQSLRSVGTSSFTAYAESAFHFTRVAVDGGVLALEMVRADGSVRDRLTLTRATPTTTSTTAPTSTTLDATSTTTTTNPPRCPLVTHAGDGAMCDGAPLPHRIARLIERARLLTELAESAPDPTRLRARLALVFRRIDRAVARAEAAGRISPACADELSSLMAGCV